MNSCFENELSANTKYKHLQKIFNKIKELRNVKSRVVGTKMKSYYQ